MLWFLSRLIDVSWLKSNMWHTSYKGKDYWVECNKYLQWIVAICFVDVGGIVYLSV